MNRSSKGLLWGALLLGAGFAIGHETARTGAATPATVTGHQPSAASAAPTSARRVLYWVSPMNPHQRSNHFKKDSMNMAYVPVYAPDTGGPTASTGLKVDSRMMQTLGVRVVAAKTRLLSHTITTVGTITVDDNRRYDVNLRVSGWIVALNARAVGDTVHKGQVLARIYAPKLYAAESEYLIARQQRDVLAGDGVVRAATQHLRLLGMSAGQVKALAARKRAQKLLTLRAPANGTVLALGARAGGYVTPGTTLFKLVDLSRVWARIALYSYQMPWVQVGDRVQLQLASVPGRNWTGTISFLYPTLDTASRTIEARVPLSNRQGLLRPGLYVHAEVAGAPRTALAVPSDAVLRMAGTDYVMQATGQGHFLPTQVLLGPASGNWVEIRQGLKPGDAVAESAQFLLYAESQLQQIRARMLGATPAPARPDGAPRASAGDQP